MLIKRLLGAVLLLALVCGCVTHTINSDGSIQSNSVDKVKLSDTYIELAIQYQQRGAPQVALERANLAIKTNSENPRAFMIRAMIYQQLGQNADAEGDFKQALWLKDGYAEDNVNYAVFLCAEKRYPEAMANFAKALGNPLYYTPEVGYFSRGSCYFKQGDLTAANADFLKAMSYRNVPQGTYIAMARLQYANKNYQLANFYINKFSDSQTPATLLLHIQILQALIDAGVSAAKLREYTSYRNTLGQLLVKNYGDTPEAQQYQIEYESGNHKPPATSLH